MFSSYLSFRLLGSALPHLSLPQLKEVLSGEVMMQYGVHVVSAQVRTLNQTNPRTGEPRFWTTIRSRRLFEYRSKSICPIRIM